LLFALAEEISPSPNCYGIDYSSDAVALSKEIAVQHGGPAEDISFHVCDFLNEDVPTPTKGWDLILDKGTLDAIALGDKDSQGRSPAWAYPSRLARLLRPGSIFLVTCERAGRLP
jgi:SAM-dependent methyltransferase